MEALAALEHLCARPVMYAPAGDERPRVDRAEMMRYLGYHGQDLEPELAARIDAVVADVERDAVPRGVRQVFEVDADGADADGRPCIRLAGTGVVLQGRDIYRHLKDARAAAVVACTLGMGCERRLRVLGTQHPLDGAVYDAACSSLVEVAVGQMDAAVAADAKAGGLATNWRFSCGYGDCPLTAQRPLVAAVNASRLLGLTVTPTNLLLPSKSVTAVIGIFDGTAASADDRPACTICRMREHCRFRAAGTTCYKG